MTMALLSLGPNPVVGSTHSRASCTSAGVGACPERTSLRAALAARTSVIDT